MLRLRRDDGFMMVELLMAITIMAIALTALVAVFSSGITSMGDSSERTTATLLADAQMETYDTMLYRDIGLDLSDPTVAGLDSTYTNDAACRNPGTGDTCATSGADGTESGPTGTTLIPDSCSTINNWYPNTLPCVPSRTVTTATTPRTPDGRSYRVDTYIALAPAVTAGTGQRTEYKQVTVVVRDGRRLGTVLARESSDFVCLATALLLQNGSTTSLSSVNDC